MIYAVIDTNIIVSSFLTKNEMAATRRVINSVLDGLLRGCSQLQGFISCHRKSEAFS